jgi:prostaglandin-H2 D-isomerase / glutathione transferase
MTKPKLTYFDAPVSRGEECRLALHLAGIEFEDVRVKPPEWAAHKAAAPFGAVPTYEEPGKPVLAESNAILVYIGRRGGLHPKDDFEAARHEMMMSQLEVLRTEIGRTMQMPDEEKRTARQRLAATVIPAWAANAERQIGDGPLFGGAALHVVDLKFFMVLRWIASGKLDHLPADTLASFAKLGRIHDAVRDHAGVRAWYARS